MSNIEVERGLEPTHPGFVYQESLPQSSLIRLQVGACYE